MSEGAITLLLSIPYPLIWKYSNIQYTKYFSALFHPALKREDRLGKEPFAGFGTVVEDISESGYTKNQPILLGFF